MITRIIYDATGFIISQKQGSNLYTPVGVNYLDAEIPVGKYVVSIDVNVTPNVPIFDDLPKSEVQLLQEKTNVLETDQLALSEITLDLLLKSEVI